MNRLLSILFVLITISNWSQAVHTDVMEDGLIRDIKYFDNHYLIEIDHLKYEEKLHPYLLDHNRDYYSDGLAYMNSEFDYKWIFAPELGGISDFWEDDEFIYILNSRGTNSKTSSSASLYLLKLNSQGKLLKTKKIGERDFDLANGRMYGYFGPEGTIWSFTHIPKSYYSYDNHHPFRKGRPGDNYDLKIMNLNLDSLASYYLAGDYLDFEAVAFNTTQASFVFSTNSPTMDDKEIDAIDQTIEETLSEILIQFDKNGNLIKQKYIGHGNCWVEEMIYQGDNLVLMGDFENEETMGSEFMGQELTAPKSYISDKFARNSFIASINNNLDLNWVKSINGTCDILSNSVDALNDSIALCFHFKDSVRIGDDKFYSSKDSTKYQYSDPIICFFNANGALIGNDIMHYYSTSWNNVYLFPNHTYVHGSFLHSLEVLGEKLNSPSKNSVYYQSFFDR